MDSIEDMFAELDAKLNDPAAVKQALPQPVMQTAPSNRIQKRRADPILARNMKNAAYAAMGIVPRDNLVFPETREAITGELSRIEATARLSEVSICTATIAAYYPGVQMDVARMMPFLTATEWVRVIHSNFGIVSFSDEDRDRLLERKEAAQLQKTAKQRAVQRRRTQGSGTDFNSQITFEVFFDGPLTEHPLKFKIFQTGAVQLPRALPSLMTQVWRGFSVVESVLHAALVAERGDRLVVEPFPPLSCKFAYYVLKNYKFVIRMDPKELLRLDVLQQICHDERMSGREKRLVVSPRSAHSSSLTLVFTTPQPHKPEKELFMQIFMYGKVGILGGLLIDDTIYVYQFLDRILREYWARIVA